MNISTQEGAVAAINATPVIEAHDPNGASAPEHKIEQAIVIEPTAKLPSLQLREIWEHRELLYFLVWRDLKVRYKQTALGVVWVLLQPLLMTMIFTVVLGRIIRMPTQKVPYPLFAYTGLTLWIFFASAVSITG